MAKIIGIIVVLASVIGGYVLSHGKVMALFQPYEVLIIGGAALGGSCRKCENCHEKQVLSKHHVKIAVYLNISKGCLGWSRTTRVLTLILQTSQLPLLYTRQFAERVGPDPNPLS